MTERQAIARFKSLKKAMNAGIEREFVRLLKSGAIDVSAAANDYELPKAILHVALANVSADYRPLSRQANREVVNLKYF
jgi:hypothetical protein